jgi:hypothetical protein
MLACLLVPGSSGHIRGVMEVKWESMVVVFGSLICGARAEHMHTRVDRDRCTRAWRAEWIGVYVGDGCREGAGARSRVLMDMEWKGDLVCMHTGQRVPSFLFDRSDLWGKILTLILRETI